MTSVCITSEYCTLIYYDARFDPKTILVNMLWQGFMHDQIIASHTYFGGHMDVNC